MRKAKDLMEEYEILVLNIIDNKLEKFLKIKKCFVNLRLQKKEDKILLDELLKIL